MLFFYKSHTTMVSYKENRKNLYDAAQHATPTHFRICHLWKKHLFPNLLKIQKAIGETEYGKRRASSFISFSGSLTVEAAVVLPLFLSAVLLLSGLFQTMAVCSQVNQYLCMTGRKIAAYSCSADGVNQGDLYKVFYPEIRKSGIDAERIVGGYAGLIPQMERIEDGQLVRLRVYFAVKISGYLLPDRTAAAVETVYVRPWTGAVLSEYRSLSGSSQSDTVYVAENGVVYHKDTSCSHLALSIHTCQMSQLEKLRNQYGARYVPCERCGHPGDGNTNVYITETGRAWHTDRHCSGLKRTLEAMSQEEAAHSGLRPCSRCGMD